MENHLKAWRAHRALAWLYGVVLVAIAASVAVTARPVRMDAVFASLAGLALFFVLHFALARGSLGRRPWARIGTMLFGFVLLVAFPVGTLIGAYLISVSWNPWTQPMTQGSPAASGWPSDAVRDRPRVTGR